jgi:hypothetical protein
MGRKKLDENDFRGHKHTVRLSNSENEKFIEKATQLGLKPSEYLYRLTKSVKIVPRLNKDEKDEVKDLVGMANNLNQLAHMGHKFGFPLVEKELLELRAYIVTVFKKYN